MPLHLSSSLWAKMIYQVLGSFQMKDRALRAEMHLLRRAMALWRHWSSTSTTLPAMEAQVHMSSYSASGPCQKLRIRT
jgi:hypothetical protein